MLAMIQEIELPVGFVAHNKKRSISNRTHLPTLEKPCAMLPELKRNMTLKQKFPRRATVKLQGAIALKSINYKK